MGYQSIFFDTELSDSLIDEINNKFNHSDELQKSTMIGNIFNPKFRDSENTWISSSYWLGGFIWYYIDKANKTNFFYDITDIDCDRIQYTQYKKGQHYNWHSDTSISDRFSITKSANEGLTPEYINQKIVVQQEYCRKLSFSIQLSDPSEYEGGELQFQEDNGNVYFAPKNKGTIIVFDSRARHRVRKVKSGVRRSLVGWAIGPRWK